MALLARRPISVKPSPSRSYGSRRSPWPKKVAAVRPSRLTTSAVKPADQPGEPSMSSYWTEAESPNPAAGAG
jgi:hypothetical protein